MEHSPKFYKIKEYFEMGFWTAKMVKNAVNKKLITEEEYEEITGGD